MHYYYEDVAHLLRAVPCLSLAKPAGALRILKRIVEAGEELQPLLAQYPSLRYEPLDFHYICLQSLGAFSKDLLDDLIQHHGWPGTLWATLLVALNPQPEYARALETARPRAPHQVWLVDLVLSIVTGTESEEFPEHQALLRTLRAQLTGLAWPRVTLRRLPSRQDIEEHSRQVRTAYRQRGADAALTVIRRRAL